MRDLLFVSLLCVFVSLPAQAERLVYMQKMTGPLTVSDAQTLNRNSQLGNSYLMDLKFKEWIPLEVFTYEGIELDDNVIGLTEEGKVYQVVTINGHTVSRLLSGESCIKHIELAKPKNILLAESCMGSLLAFTQKEWQKTPWIELATQQGILTGLGISAITVLVAALSASDISSDAAKVIAGFAVAMQYIGQGVLGFNKFKILNLVPDGFIKLKTDVRDLNDLKTSDLELLDKEDWTVNCTSLFKTHISKDLLQKY